MPSFQALATIGMDAEFSQPSAAECWNPGATPRAQAEATRSVSRQRRRQSEQIAAVRRASRPSGSRMQPRFGSLAGVPVSRMPGLGSLAEVDPLINDIRHDGDDGASSDDGSDDDDEWEDLSICRVMASAICPPWMTVAALLMCCVALMLLISNAVFLDRPRGEHCKSFPPHRAHHHKQSSSRPIALRARRHA